MSSTTCCRAFIRHWVSRYGIPDEIVTDWGSQFVGGSWAELMKSLGIRASSTTAYHPQCNGLIERFHRQLKASIRASLRDSSWQDTLPLVMLGLRSAWKEGPEASPADLLYGTELRLPGQFVPGAEISDTTPISAIVSSFQQKMRFTRTAPSRHHTSSAVPFTRLPWPLPPPSSCVMTGSVVLSRTLMMAPSRYSGPATNTSRFYGMDFRTRSPSTVLSRATSRRPVPPWYLFNRALPSPTLGATPSFP